MQSELEQGDEDLYIHILFRFPTKFIVTAISWFGNPFLGSYYYDRLALLLLGFSAAYLCSSAVSKNGFTATSNRLSCASNASTFSPTSANRVSGGT